MPAETATAVGISTLFSKYWGFIVAIFVWVAGYATMRSDVNRLKADLKDVKVLQKEDEDRFRVSLNVIHKDLTEIKVAIAKLGNQ